MDPKLAVFLIVLLSSGLVYADGPHYVHKDVSTQLEFEDLYQVMGTKLSTVTIPSQSTSVSPGSTNYIQNTANPTTGTQVFSVSSGTVSTLNSVTANITNSLVSTETWKGFGILPILQIQYFSTSTSSSTASTSYILSTLSGSITPKLNTSKIIVLVSGTLSCSGGGIAYASIFRGSTDLCATSGGFALTGGNNSGAPMIAYDNPATTSATTYSVKIRDNAGATNAIFPSTDGGSFTSTATMLLVELAQ